MTALEEGKHYNCLDQMLRFRNMVNGMIPSILCFAVYHVHVVERALSRQLRPFYQQLSRFRHKGGSGYQYPKVESESLFRVLDILSQEGVLYFGHWIEIRAMLIF